jgi:hypothetical protein
MVAIMDCECIFLSELKQKSPLGDLGVEIIGCKYDFSAV